MPDRSAGSAWSSARTPATLPELARAAVTTSLLGIVIVVIGGALLLVRPLRTVTAVVVVLVVVMVLGAAVLGAALAMYVAARRWNTARRGDWGSLAISVVPEDADWERRRTLLDSRDGSWRIAIVEYPLELRDVLVGGGQIEYVGTLATDQRILIRVPGSRAEHFAGVKRRLVRT